MTLQDWLLGTGVALLLGAALLLVRAFLGPTLYDRVLAANAIGSKTVAFVALLAFLSPPVFGLYLDIALAYALINFVAIIGVLKYVEQRRLDT